MTICVPDDTDWSCAPDGFTEGLAEGVQARAEALAWTTLQALSGYRLSVCPVTVRPCSRQCLTENRTWEVAPVAWGYTFRPGINIDGHWINGCGCMSNTECGCGVRREVRLVGPVGGIEEVNVGGAILSPSAYRVDNGDILVRVDGGEWPLRQNMQTGPTSPDYFSVTYYQGFAPDELSKQAAGLLAREYAKACMGGQCELPSRVTQIVRQGVTMTIPQGVFPDGTTGITIVDAWLYSVNPNGLRMAPTISSPDYKRNRMTTWG